MTVWQWLLLVCMSSALPLHAGDALLSSSEKTTRFVVIGDMPYTDAEYALLE